VTDIVGLQCPTPQQVKVAPASYRRQLHPLFAEIGCALLIVGAPDCGDTVPNNRVSE
jgi:hypothetical protein